jgi:hypothetical protein
MANVQSTVGWTKTDLGSGWTKLTEVCPVFGTGTTDEMRTTPITNTTASAVTDAPSMALLNELRKAGNFVVEVVIGAGASFDGDTYIEAADSADAYHTLSGKLIDGQTPSTTKIVTWNDAITANGLKVLVAKVAGGAANPCTVNIVYYNGGPTLSDVTIGGVGADPS